jgi:hypothetical protein
MSGLSGAVISIGAGIALAFYVVRKLQRRGLKWTWSLFGVPIAALLGSLDWRIALFLWVASFFSLLGGRGAHHEALRAGGEEAREKREAIGPLRAVWSATQRQLGRERRERPGAFVLGEARRGGICQVPTGWAEGKHGLVLGATGSGKTVTQASLVQAYLRSGMSAVVVDPKGDDDLLEVLVETAEECGARFQAWTPEGPSVYNPLARGGVTEIADKALAAHEWSEPHYELATQRLLGYVLSTMEAAGKWPPTLTEVVALMNPERLDALASEVGGELAERVSSYVDGLSGRAISDLGGGRDRLAVLAESDLAPWLVPAQAPDGAEEIDLQRAVSGYGITYFHLDSDRYPAASKLLGASLLIDLVTLSADGAGEPALLAIDEFAAIAAPHISRLFARARSARISLLLGTQSLADLRDVGGGQDVLVEQVLSNVEYTVAHRIPDPDSAEQLARMAGTVPSWSVTERINGHGPMIAKGEGTRTREREFVIQPDEFKRLGTGEAILIKPKSNPPAEFVRVWPPQRERVAR